MCELTNDNTFHLSNTLSHFLAHSHRTGLLKSSGHARIGSLHVGVKHCRSAGDSGLKGVHLIEFCTEMLHIQHLQRCYTHDKRDATHMLMCIAHMTYNKIITFSAAILSHCSEQTIQKKLGRIHCKIQ